MVIAKSLAVLGLLGALTRAQTNDQEPLVLPASATETDEAVVIPTDGKTADIKFLKLPAGSVQPLISKTQISDKSLTFHLSRIFFWGYNSLLEVQVDGKNDYIYPIIRGPNLYIPKSGRFDVYEGKATQLWLYNFEADPVTVRWRITSGTDAICGTDKDGVAQTDCQSADQWSKLALGPIRSQDLRFVVPSTWFQLTDKHASQGAQLELLFGSSDIEKAPREPFELPLTLHTSYLYSFLPDALWGTSIRKLLGDLLWVIFGVTFGAALLMLAQVMIPNFRKCLRMESDIDGLTEGLHAIDSGVEGRLYSRCQQEVENARSALFMKASDAFSQAIASFDLWSRFRGRFALSGDSFEVDRLASLLPRINTRISCTQRLNDCQLASASRAMRLPVSLQWQRRQFFLDVQRILSTRLLTETDENSVSASLDKLTDDTGSYAAFAADLENRLALLRKQFGVDPLKTKSSSLISQLNGCRQLLDETPTNATFGVDELISRDLRAIRLELVRQRFDLEALLSSDFSKNFSTEICSEDPVRLYAVRGDLLMASEGVTEAQIRAALEAGRIDAISEPVSLTNRDLFRVSLQFRNPALQHSTARRFFQCDWHVVPQTKGHEKGENKDDYYEDGWETQFMLRRGCYLISPRVRDRDGQEIPLVDDQRQPRTPFTVEVTAPPGSALYARAWRGLVDALITALVPVITVAVTQFQAGGNLSLSTLILLGFTSQAIRAAVLPESVTAPLKTSSPTTNT